MQPTLLSKLIYRGTYWSDSTEGSCQNTYICDRMNVLSQGSPMLGPKFGSEPSMQTDAPLPCSYTSRWKVSLSVKLSFDSSVPSSKLCMRKHICPYPARPLGPYQICVSEPWHHSLNKSVWHLYIHWHWQAKTFVRSSLLMLAYLVSICKPLADKGDWLSHLNWAYTLWETSASTVNGVVLSQYLSDWLTVLTVKSLIFWKLRQGKGMIDTCTQRGRWLIIMVLVWGTD